MRKKQRKLSDPQMVWLKFLAGGPDPRVNWTRSEYGGSCQTKRSLRRMGLLDYQWKITANGLEAVGIIQRRAT